MIKISNAIKDEIGKLIETAIEDNVKTGDILCQTRDGTISMASPGKKVSGILREYGCPSDSKTVAYIHIIPPLYSKLHS